MSKRRLTGTGTRMWSDTYKAGMAKRLVAMGPISIGELAARKGISERTAQNMIYEIASSHPVFSEKDDNGVMHYEVIHGH